MIQDVALLQYALQNGMIDLQCLQKQVEMDKRIKILELHPYGVTFNEKKRRWYTRFKVDGEVVQRNRIKKEELEDLIVDFYNNGETFRKEVIYEKYSFAQAHDRWLEMQYEYGKDENTIYKYESDWRRFFAGTEFEKKDIVLITPQDIETFMINQIKTFNLKRQAGVTLYGYISGVFYNAVMDKKISKDDNPCDLVDKKKFVKFYNKDKKKPEDRVISIVETEQLLNKIHNEIKERPSSLYPYGVQLSLLTGMRVGEICGLRWENVLDDRIVICESEKYNQSTKRYYQSDTKTDKERTLPITDDLRKFFKTMKSLQTKYGSDKDFVISTANGKLHTRNLSDYMIKSSKKLGFNVSKGIHTIRRTFNSYMRQSGISAVMAGSIIGNTAEVNNNHYTYDICDMKTKKELVSKIEDKMILRFAHDAHEEIQ